MQKFSEHKIEPIYATPGTILTVTHKITEGDRVVKETEFAQVEIDKELVIDKIDFYWLQEELGFKSAIAAVMGKSNGTE